MANEQIDPQAAEALIGPAPTDVRGRARWAAELRAYFLIARADALIERMENHTPANTAPVKPAGDELLALTRAIIAITKIPSRIQGEARFIAADVNNGMWVWYAFDKKPEDRGHCWSATGKFCSYVCTTYPLDNINNTLTLTEIP
jgi:hypothetical protein